MFTGIVALAALCAVTLVAPPREAPLLVSAAISLTDALEEIAAAYVRAGGGAIRFNFAGSNVLARQIANGAPSDLFISADEAQMHFARAAGAVGRPEPLLGNRLAIVTPAAAHRITGLDQLASARRIAIGDPAAVPAGVYARRYLESAGLWDRIQPQLVPLANVRSALAAAESGGVDAAIVYESDAAASKRVRLAFVVDERRAPAIIYPAAIVANSPNKQAAARFLAFLRGREAGAIFKRHRFCPLAPTAGAALCGVGSRRLSVERLVSYPQA